MSSTNSTLLPSIGAINLITIDLIYSGLPKLPVLGEEVVTHTFDLQLGGGPVASAVTALRLGADVRLATCLREDRMSLLARSLLEKEGIAFASFDRLPKQESPVNVSSVLTFAGSDRCFASYFPQDNFTDDNEEDIYQYLKGCGFCIASTPCPDLFRRLRRNGTKIAFDIGWQDDMSLDKFRSIWPLVELFTPNDKEAMKLTGAGSPEQAIKILSGAVPHAVVKLGKQGCLLYENDSLLHIPGGDFHAVDTTGAGDAFLGGMVYGLTRGWSLERCAALGNYTGGKATTMPGCLAAKCTPEEATEYLKSHEPIRG